MATSMTDDLAEAVAMVSRWEPSPFREDLAEFLCDRGGELLREVLRRPLTDRERAQAFAYMFDGEMIWADDDAE